MRSSILNILNMKSFVLLLVVCAVAVIGCSKSTVVLKSADGNKKFVYDCNSFRPQIETGEDIALLAQEAVKTLQDAVKVNAYVSIKEISDAMDKGDWRELEKAVVSYRCAHKN